MIIMGGKDRLATRSIERCFDWLSMSCRQNAAAACLAWRDLVGERNEVLVVCGGRGIYGHKTECVGLVDGKRWRAGCDQKTCEVLP